MLEAVQGFRRLGAHKQLPTLRVAPLAHEAKHTFNGNLEQQATAA
jgi:putative transposase